MGTFDELVTDPRAFGGEDDSLPEALARSGEQRALGDFSGVRSNQYRRANAIATPLVLEKGVADVTEAALRGELPGFTVINNNRAADLLQRLRPLHLRIVRLSLQGMSNKQIATHLTQRLGRNIDYQLVAKVMRHPAARQLVAAHHAEEVKRADEDFTLRMKQAARESFELLYDIATTSTDENVVARVGFGILDRAGYGPPVRGSSVGGGVTVNVGVSLPAEKLDSLEAALEAAARVAGGGVMHGREVHQALPPATSPTGSVQGEVPPLTSTKGSSEIATSPSRESVSLDSLGAEVDVETGRSPSAGSDDKTEAA